MQVLSRQLFHLQQGQIRTKNRFRQLLVLTCPEYNELFSRQFLFSRTALHFIETYPHCDMVKSESVATLEKCLGAPYRKRTYNYRKMAEKIKSSLDDSFAAVPVSSLTVCCVVDTIHRLRIEIAEIESIKEKLIALAEHTPLYELYLSIPGIGPITAALLVAELKDIRRFDNIKKLIASCGLDPTIVQSGRTINYHGPISKRGNRNARYVLFNTIMSLLMNSNSSTAFCTARFCSTSDMQVVIRNSEFLLQEQKDAICSVVCFKYYSFDDVGYNIVLSG